VLQVRFSASGTDQRIAFVSGGLKLGGATTFLCNLAGELVRRRIPVEVLSFEAENPLNSDFQRSNIPVHCQNERRIIFEDRLAAILDKVRQFQATTVIATLSAMSFEVLRYLPDGVFRIGMVQSDDPDVYKMVGFYGREVDLMAAVSGTIKTRLESMPEFSGVKVGYLPYGVPMPAQPRREREPNEQLRILFLGRIIRAQKRVHLFPEILAELKRSGIPFEWTIAGDGPDQEWLRQQLPSGGRDQAVSFTGKVAYAEVPGLLAEHDVFLLTSDYEGLPLALLEAMAFGLVPVVSDLQSGIGEVVNESNGKRIKPDNVQGYAQAIVWLHQHRDLMRRLAENARETVKRDYSVEAMTGRWLGFLPKQISPLTWPDCWRIKAPLSLEEKLRFTMPARFLRRYLLRLRNWKETAQKS